MILLDTNVISELVKTQPNPAVLAYVDGLSQETVFTAAVCEAEIRYGLARMPDCRKRNELIACLSDFSGSSHTIKKPPGEGGC
jgi:predicted nucleic acid-binding protein